MVLRKRIEGGEPGNEVEKVATKFFKLTKAAVATQVNFFSYERSLEIEILKEKVVIIFKTHKNVIQE